MIWTYLELSSIKGPCCPVWKRLAIKTVTLRIKFHQKPFAQGGQTEGLADISM
jgi:hypothetical protein